MGETGSGSNILVENPERNRYFGRLGRKQEGKNKVDFEERVSEILGSLHQAKRKD
jgi:hypothetical protein